MTSPRCEVSIIIPTRNRAAILGRCLEALARQTIPSEGFEVIVSDDGSSDETRNVVEGCARGALEHVRYLRQENRGASAARNRAIEQASGALLLMINDDTISTATLVEEHLRAHRQYPAESSAVLGRVTISPDLPRSLFATLHLDAAYKTLAGHQVAGWKYFITSNLSVSRSFLLRHGTFDERIRVQHEDIELGQRLSAHGLTIHYWPEALAYHYHFIDASSFLKSAVQDGDSLARWYKKAPHLTQELASVGFYATTPPAARVKYWLADSAVNSLTIPVLMRVATRLSDRHESIALALYRKVYQSVKRRSIRRELKALDC